MIHHKLLNKLSEINLNVDLKILQTKIYLNNLKD